MVGRREFIQAGVAATTLPALSGMPLSGAFAGPAPMPLYKVLFDRRFPSSIAYGEAARAQGLDTHGIDGDMTSFWYDELHGRWRGAPVAIAGLTAHGPIFCLERLAWDHGMRVVYRGDHASRPDGRLEHVVSGPGGMLLHAARLAAGGPDWGRQAAGLLARCPEDAAAVCRSAAAVAISTEPVHEPEPLVSWVIAPVRRA